MSTRKQGLSIYAPSLLSYSCSMRRPSERTIFRLFEIGLIIKAIDGALETLGGILLVTLPVHTLNRLVRFLTLHELVHDPHDFIATHLVQITETLTTNAKLVAAFYLLIHGLVKILLVVNLLRNKLWAYPVAMAVLSTFILYQLYRFTHHHAWWLLVLSLFDLIIVVLTWHEYQLRKKANAR